jgi:hypothetical protein
MIAHYIKLIDFDQWEWSKSVPAAMLNKLHSSRAINLYIYRGIN